MPKFILCPKLVDLSARRREYWLHVLLKILQKDSYKVLMDKNDRIIEEYDAIGKLSPEIKVWIVNMSYDYEKNFKKVNCIISNGTELIDGIIDIASSVIVKEDRVILTVDQDCYSSCQDKIALSDIKILDKDEAKVYMDEYREGDNIIVGSVISVGGLQQLGRGNKYKKR